MMDLSVAILMLAGGCVFAVALGMRIGQLSPGRSLSFQVMGVALMLGYLLFLWNRPVLTHLLPGSNLIILANWLPLWACYFVGVYLVGQKVSVLRRTVLASIAVCFCGYSIVAPTLGQSPVCQTTSHRYFQHQTTPYTCSAACAVSLLQLHGISASESEMASLSLTREGTHWMGLYRGLKIKTEGTGWDVVAEPLDIAKLRSHSHQPCVMSLKLDITQFPEHVDHGFRDDCGHSVLYLGSKAPGRITVFDPSPDYGVEQWDDSVIDCVEDGVVLRLVPVDLNNPKTLHVSRRLAVAMLNGRMTAQL